VWALVIGGVIGALILVALVALFVLFFFFMPVR
jgi:hypothetical protein